MTNNKKSIMIRVITAQNAYIQNMGFDCNEMLKKFKLLNGFEPTDNGFEITNDELGVIINNILTNGEVIGVYNYPNNYNRDQAELNIIKRKYENELKLKGYTIIEHCEWQPHFDDEKLEKIINERNYLTNILEQIKLKETKISKLESELISLQNDIDETKKYLKEIKKEKDLIKQEKDLANDELNKIIERYKNGLKYVQQLENSLPEDVLKQKQQLDEINKEIEEKKQEKNKLIETINDYKNKIYNESTELKEIQKNVSKLHLEINESEKLIEEKKDELKSLTETLMEYNNLKEDLIRTIKMYKLNNRSVPDFEIERFLKRGFSKELINSIENNIQKY